MFSSIDLGEVGHEDKHMKPHQSVPCVITKTHEGEHKLSLGSSTDSGHSNLADNKNNNSNKHSYLNLYYDIQTK